MIADSGVRSSWLMLAMNWLFTRLAASARSRAARSSASVSRGSVMSSCTPTHSCSVPRSSNTGTARTAHSRHAPSCRRTRCSKAKLRRPATASAHAVRVGATSSGCTARSQPSAWYSARFCPVKRDQSGCSPTIRPSGVLVQMMSPTASAATRNRASLVRSSRCARCWLMVEASRARNRIMNVAPTTHSPRPCRPAPRAGPAARAASPSQRPSRRGQRRNPPPTCRCSAFPPPPGPSPPPRAAAAPIRWCRKAIDNPAVEATTAMATDSATRQGQKLIATGIRMADMPM